MRIFITSGSPTERSDIPELQAVIKHCVDSCHDYTRAAGSTACPLLAARLAGTAANRHRIVQEFATMIRAQGGQPRQGPSLAGTLRRAWGTFLDNLGGSAPAAAVAACLRGERALLDAVERALDSQEITSGHAAALRSTRQEIAAAMRTKKAAASRRRPPHDGPFARARGLRVLDDLHVVDVGSEHGEGRG